MSKALEDYPGCAVLELAAGLGTRGVLESPSREAYIETDLESLLSVKQKVVDKLVGEGARANHYFRPVNVTKVDDMNRIEKFLGELKLSRPIAIIHEGLLMYFNEQEQRTVRDSIARLIANHKPGGVWLTSDFSERDLDKTSLQKLMSTRLSNQVGRKLNYFADNDSVVQFLSEGDLRCEWIPNNLPQLNATARAYAENFRIHRITVKAALDVGSGRP